MSNQENDARDRYLRERIVSLMRANTQALRKPIPGIEVQQLKTAANRLAQMLKAAEDANRRNLETAATRLNQMLIDIRNGKDVTTNLKRR